MLWHKKKKSISVRKIFYMQAAASHVLSTFYIQTFFSRECPPGIKKKRSCFYIFDFINSSDSTALHWELWMHGNMSPSCEIFHPPAQTYTGSDWTPLNWIIDKKAWRGELSLSFALVSYFFFIFFPRALVPHISAARFLSSLFLFISTIITHHFSLSCLLFYSSSVAASLRLLVIHFYFSPSITFSFLSSRSPKSAFPPTRAVSPSPALHKVYYKRFTHSFEWQIFIKLD